MANPLEKQFLIIRNTLTGIDNEKYMNFIETKLVPVNKKGQAESKNYLHWMRMWSGKLYIIGSTENTTWTVEKLYNKINKVIPSATIFIIFQFFKLFNLFKLYIFSQ